MNRFFKFFLTVNLVSFLLYAGLGNLYAQDDPLSQGNIIKEIVLINEDGIDYIVVRGDLKPSELKGIFIKKSDQQKKFIISLPSTLIDPEAITAPFISFGPEDPVSNIQILETIKEQEESEEVSFVVELVVKGNKVLVPKVIRPITSTDLKIEIRDFDQVEEERLAAEKQEEEEQRQLEEEALAESEDELLPETDMMEVLEDDAEFAITEDEASNTVQIDVATILKKYRKPSIMQVSILNASGRAKRAYKLSVYLGKLRKRYIEETLGMKMDIVNISNAMNRKNKKTAIYFKENFIKPALFLSSLIPGNQRIIPMKHKNGKVGLDIEIYIGTDYK